MSPDLPRILLAGDRSSSGKTTIVAGLLSALRNRGLAIQSYKVALDYIDPSYHTGITGRWCRNLDGHLMPEKTIREVYAHAAEGADVAVIEGVRGLYEGYDGDRGSTAQIAKMLRSPVILVVDARSITRSAAALVKGYVDFDPDVEIKGVILNKIGGQRHTEKAISAIRDHAGVEVVGVIPRDESMHLSMRHLGLVPMLEGERRQAGFAERLAKIREVVEEGLDIDRILEIAAEAEPLEEPVPDLYLPNRTGEGVRIGVALDEAFNFYYRENVELMELSGAEVVPVSPIHDPALPEIDGLYIGGGYPELYSKELSENGSMMESIRRAHEDDIPIFAECGGLMYLCEEIDWGGESHPAVGLVPAKTRKGGRRIVSYTEGEFLRDCSMGPRGAKFLGHEFHHSELVLDEGADVEYAIRLRRGTGIEKGMDGIVDGNLVASYNHFHAASYREFPRHFIKCAREARDK
ncbi:MAG TPA: Ni-sirohydrochlorin a,c-diamide synthase [Methanothrix sp.]|nr:Ni-sirohydrochlorin a,c-diamide synthase [Methanothrix sp.]HPJ85275.1 Ni-sirohydrochlorin a,c-diamide synthase [Methanothrix sp.]